MHLTNYLRRCSGIALSISSIFIMALAVHAGTPGPEKRHIAGEKVPAGEKINADWSLYSWGLYYKGIGIKEKSAAEKEALLRKAVQFFNSAAAGRISLDKTYFQLAECYYYLNDFNASLENARKAKAVDRTDVRIYNRIYYINLKLKKYEEAANILEEYLKVKPDSVQVQFILAEHYYKNMNNMDRAAGAYRQVIALSDRLPVEDYYKEQSLFVLGHIAYRQGEMENALSAYRSVLEINKDNEEALFYCALSCMEIYNIAEAEKYSLQYLKRKPDNKIINSVLGRVYYIMDDIRALSYLNGARGSGSMSGMLSLGLYYEIVRKDDLAVKALEGVMKFAPKTITAHIAMARILERKKDATAAFNEYVTAGILLYNSKLYEESRRNFTEALRLNDRVPGVYYYLGKVHEDMRLLSLALYYYKEANRLQPDTDLMLHIGYLYGVVRNYDSAFQFFNTASERDPKNSRPYFFKGLVSIWQEDYTAAEKQIQRAITLDDKSETYYFYFAIVMDKMEQLTRAVDSLEKAIKTNPSSARAYNYLGYLYADNNMKIDESVALILRALELEPGNGAYTDSLGWAYFRKGNYAQALEKLLAAEEILRRANTPDPVVYDHIGDTFLMMGKKSDALRYWNRSNEIKKSESVISKIKKHQDVR